jgi:hypothetical protein
MPVALNSRAAPDLWLATDKHSAVKLKGMTRGRASVSLRADWAIPSAVAWISFAGIWTVWLAASAYRQGVLALDVRAAYLPAARALQHGASPFPPLTAAAVAHNDAYLYPPLVGWLFAPLSWLPLTVAEAMATVLAVAASAAALWLLDVRDWRCYAILMFLPPVLVGVQTANVTVALVAGSAAVWRWRAHARRSGIILGLLVAAKLVLVPLLLWLVASRRYRAACWAAASAFVFILLPWALIGFSGLRTYPQLLRLVGRVEGPESYTLGALLGHGGHLLAIGAGVAALAVIWWLGRRGRDAAAFALAIVSVLLLSPVVWLTYFALLLVPLAIKAPCFSRWWLLTLGFWLCPGTHNGAPWQTAVALLVAVAIASYSIWMARPSSGVAATKGVVGSSLQARAG